MRRKMTALACLALVAGSWSTALAQEAEYSAAEYEGPMFDEVVEFDVSPGDAASFEMTMEKIVEAAKLAELSADYGWMFFRNGSKYTLVYPVKSMAYFDDEEQWMSQFMGTPGEATLMEAFEMFGELDYSSKSEVHKRNLAHSYMPPNPIENPNHVMVFMNWVKPGKQEAHAENTAALMQIISDVQWRYAVHAFDGVIGDGGLRLYVVPFDDMATFYGEGSLQAYLVQHEKAEEWEALMGERMKLVRAMDSQDYAFVPGMTYQPEGN
ncbi:MAG: hypothetical protein P8Y10_09985 [Gemmatimonadales bacterium]|jgi:hypothetical protein